MLLDIDTLRTVTSPSHIDFFILMKCPFLSLIQIKGINKQIIKKQ